MCPPDAEALQRELGARVSDPHSHHCKWVTVTAQPVPVFRVRGGAPAAMTEGGEYVMGKTFWQTVAAKPDGGH